MESKHLATHTMVDESLSGPGGISRRDMLIGSSAALVATALPGLHR